MRTFWVFSVLESGRKKRLSMWDLKQLGYRWVFYKFLSLQSINNIAVILIIYLDNGFDFFLLHLSCTLILFWIPMLLFKFSFYYSSAWWVHSKVHSNGRKIDERLKNIHFIFGSISSWTNVSTVLKRMFLSILFLIA